MEHGGIYMPIDSFAPITTEIQDYLDNLIFAYVTKEDIEYLLNKTPFDDEDLLPIFEGLKNYFKKTKSQLWFQQCFTPYPCKSKEDYVKLYSSIKEELVTEEDFNRFFIQNIDQLISNVPDPKKYIERIVDSFADEDCRKKTMDGSKPCLAVIILRQLAKYTHASLNEIGVIASHFRRDGHTIDQRFVASNSFSRIGNSLFAYYETPENYCIGDYTFPQGSYGHAMIDAANNFAESIFDPSGTTRLWLYFFAFAFDLRFYPDTQSADYNSQKDVSRFIKDYYTDNLIRDLDLENTMQDSPSGIGINYKNYAECIFLFFLDYRNTESRHARFIKALEMIGLVKEYSRDTPYPQPGRLYTMKMQSDLIRIFDLIYQENRPETSLIIFLGENCDTNNQGSIICLGNEEKSPAAAYIEIMSDEGMSDFFSETAPKIIQKLNRLNFDIAYNYTKNCIITVMNKLGIVSTAEEEYSICLPLFKDKIEPLLSCEIELNQQEEAFNNVRDEISQNISRTLLIQAFFWKHIKDSLELSDPKKHISFWNIQYDFCERTEQTLEKCGYASVSPKSLIDNITVFLLHFLLKP